MQLQLAIMIYSLERDKYAAMFSPTVGDRLRLADTDLLIEVENVPIRIKFVKTRIVTLYQIYKYRLQIWSGETGRGR